MSLQTLYEKDFCSWIHQNILLLKAHKLEKLDVEHLIEELEGMASRDQRELHNRLRQLLCHLLKWDYQKNKRSISWITTILEQQSQIKDLLDSSPSLKQKIEFQKAYKSALKLAIVQTKLPESIFPTECPYEFKEALARAIRLED